MATIRKTKETLKSIPSWITVETKSGTGNGESDITVAPYTGRTKRTSVITATTLGGSSDTSNINQNGKVEHITINTKSYNVSNNGGTVEIVGVSNSAALSLVGSTRINGAVYKLTVNEVLDESWNGEDDILVDGDPGSSAEYNFKITITYPVNHTISQVQDIFAVKNSEGTITSGNITVTQATGVKTYSDIKITLFNYTTIPASGGTVRPIVSYQQTWGWNGSSIGGGTISSGATLVYSGKNVNISNGEVTADSKGIVNSEETEVTTVTLKITLNGKTATDDFIVKQAENTVTNYGNVIISGGSVKDIPASGGTASQATGYTLSQTLTYSSGETRNGEIFITTTQKVTAESLGTTIKSRTKVGTLIMKASGEGKKSATKEFDVYQATNEITSYGEVSLNLITPVSLSAEGETYDIGAQVDSKFSQTITYTSGATRKGNITLEKYSVNTPKEGFSLNTETGEVTVTKNDTTAARNGFIVSVNITGEGSKTINKLVTFNQQGSESFINIIPDTLEFGSEGGTQSITIETNESWTIS